MTKFFKKAAVVAVAVVATAPAFAIDTAGVTAEITAAGTAVGVIGGAVLVVMVGMKVFKWMRGAL